MKKIATVVFVIFALVTVFFLYKQLSKDIQIPLNAVNLGYPLKDGSFRVMYAGKSYGVHQAEGEEYALDIVRVTNIRDIFKGDSTYGTPVYSPCYGNIKDMHDGEPDEKILVMRKGATANSVIIGCEGFDVLMAHFKEGTFKVKQGDIVNIGDEIAQIGNSGYSGGPHLHINAFILNQDKENRVGVPITFEGRYLVKGSIFSKP